MHFYISYFTNKQVVHTLLSRDCLALGIVENGAKSSSSRGLPVYQSNEYARLLRP